MLIELTSLNYLVKAYYRRLLLAFASIIAGFIFFALVIFDIIILIAFLLCTEEIAPFNCARLVTY
jgi:hypothetical protein